jgi:hypothetical protein
MQLVGYGYPVGRVETAILGKNTLARPEVDGVSVDVLQPGMPMTIGEKEEEALHLYAPAGLEELLKTARTKVGQPFHQKVNLVETFMIGQFIEQFEHSAFYTGKPQRPA